MIRHGDQYGGLHPCRHIPHPQRAPGTLLQEYTMRLDSAEAQHMAMVQTCVDTIIPPSGEKLIPERSSL